MDNDTGHTRTADDGDGMASISGGEDDSDVLDVTDGDVDMSLDLLACSSYGAEVSCRIGFSLIIERKFRNIQYDWMQSSYNR